MRKLHLKPLLILAATSAFILSGSGMLNSLLTSGASLEKPVLEKHSGYSLRFKSVAGATKYIIHDDNDYRDEIVLYPSSADGEGYLYYSTEVVGAHNVSVTAYGNGVSSTSDTIEAIPNKPVFTYGPAASLLFYDIRDGSSNYYSILKNDMTWSYVTPSDYNNDVQEEGLHKKGNALDWSDSDHVYGLMYKLKAAGHNILFLGGRPNTIESNSSIWWWGGSFENSSTKRFMDAAWQFGLKVIITDFDIAVASQNSDSSYRSFAKGRVLNAELKKALKHPAFYGINLEDEPFPGDEIAYCGDVVKGILANWHSDSELKTMPDPYFFTSLCSYNENKGEGDLFKDQAAYQAYLQDWVDKTGLDYLNFDVYTYDSYLYGTKKTYASGTVYFDPTRIMFNAIKDFKALNPGVTISQTITASNSPKMIAITHEDIYASTFLSASMAFNGYSTYEFTPGTSVVSNSASDFYGNMSDTYEWLIDANKQYEYLTGLLDGYTLASNEISNYKVSIYEGWGFGVRTSTSTFTKDTSTYKFVVNFNASTTATTTTVNVPANKLYYLFGKGLSLNSRVGTGSDVTLNNGEAILVTDQSVTSVADVASLDHSQLEKYDVVTLSDVTDVDALRGGTDFQNGTGAISVNNTFMASKENTTGSVAFRFDYETSTYNNNESEGAWTWGGANIDIYLRGANWDGYCVTVGCRSGEIYLKDAGKITSSSPIKLNTRYEIEVGAVDIKGTQQTYLYAKIDGVTVIEGITNSLAEASNVGLHKNTVFMHLPAASTGVKIDDSARKNAIIKSAPLVYNAYGSVLWFFAKTTGYIPFSTKDVNVYLSKSGEKAVTINNVAIANPLFKQTAMNGYEINFGQSLQTNDIIRINGTFSHFSSLYNKKQSIRFEDYEFYYKGTGVVASKFELDQIVSAIDLGYSVQFDGSSIKSESIKMQFSFNNDFDSKFNVYDDFGIEITCGDRVVKYSLSSMHSEDGVNYVVIDLGNAISEGHAKDEFTARAYVTLGTVTVYSESIAEESISSIVTKLYNDPSTKDQVKYLYNYLSSTSQL